MAFEPTTWISLAVAAGAACWAARSRARLRRIERAGEESARQSLDRLLSNAGHELRSPLTTLIGLIQVAEQPSLEPDQRRECLSRAMVEGRHLQDLIHDVFDYARRSDGRMTSHPVDVDLRSLLREVEASIRPQAGHKGLLLSVFADGDVPSRVRVDSDRLRQVLRVLLQNSLKFTRRGHIGLTVGMQSESRLVFRVHDTGPGMDEQQCRRAFRAHERSDFGPLRRHGGLGLGLALAACAVRELGGTIEYDRHTTGGALFTVEIPVQATRGPTPDSFSPIRLPREDEVSAEDSSGCAKRPKFRGRILLVDDSRDNQLLIRTVLKQFGLDSETAENGRVALSALEQQRFDLVLMDMQMPVLDGYSATGELRERGDETPVVALTAHALSGDREKCLESGCDDFLTKPLDRQELTRVLSRYLTAADHPKLASDSPGDSAETRSSVRSSRR